MTEVAGAGPARVALVGDRSPAVRAHGRIPMVVEALRQRDALVLEPHWIGTDEAAVHDGLDRYHAIWLVPGSPYRSVAGAVTAVRTARERGIPFLGTCGGFQHTLLEYAWDVCGLSEVGHAEYFVDADSRTDPVPDPLIVPLVCSLVGLEGAVHVSPGTLAERVLGAGRTVQRYHCSYGLNRAYLDVLTAHGLRFSGFDDEGDARIAELPGHPFFLATLFQPELAADADQPHPIIRAFAAAAAERAGAAVG
jgi:CTP synthase (UTP-ammonia lyase)